MRSPIASALVAGTVLATLAVLPARAEDAGEITGSIAAIGAPRGGLTPLAPRPATVLRPVEEAPAAPVHRISTDPATTAAPTPLPTHAPAAEAKPVEAPVAETKPVETPAAPVAETKPVETPAAPVAEAKPVEAPAAPVADTKPAETPATPVAEAKPVETPAAPVAEAKPAETPAAPVADAKPVEAPAAPVAETKPVEAPATFATASEPKPEVPATVAAVPAPVETRPIVATAPTPAPVATPAPATDAAIAAAEEERAVAEAMEAIAGPLALKGGSVEDRAERGALVVFYRERQWRPFFVGAKDLTTEGRRLAETLADAARDGLEPRDYALPKSRGATPRDRAEAEFAVAEVALRYVRHLASGRFDPTRLSDLVTPTPPRPDTAAVLRGLASGRDVAAELASWAPPHDGYRRLRAELARMRAETEVPVVRLPDGPLLSPGQKDARVALLRERLGIAATATDADPQTYDEALADAVKVFQRDRGIAANGKLGRSTVAALNGEARGTADRIADVVVNMERWRWLPRDLGELHVFVNIPDFHLDVMKAGKSIHHARVITGRPENQTPIFSETMEYVVVNPYWHVPQSIIRKEMMGKLQQGGALGRSFEVEIGNRTVDPSTVDWTQVNPAQVSIRQVPGDGNALGNIKFMFPNKHSVYIHDTSSRSLFTRAYRALSHGCVRVHEPFSFADAVLSEEPTQLGGAQLKKLIGRSEQQIMLKRHVPVHISYFTVFVEGDGKVENRADVYGHDAKMRRILGL